MNSKRPGALTAAAMAIALSLVGCADRGNGMRTLQGGGAEVACAAPYVTVSPSPVIAGEPATMTLTNLSSTCFDQGEGPDVPSENVVVSLAAEDGSWGPSDVATVTADEDFTASGAFLLPSDTEPGGVLIYLDGRDEADSGGFEVVAP